MIQIHVPTCNECNNTYVYIYVTEGIQLYVPIAGTKKMITYAERQIVRKSYRNRAYYFFGLIILVGLFTTIIQLSAVLNDTMPYQYLTLAARRRLFIARIENETVRILQKLNGPFDDIDEINDTEVTVEKKSKENSKVYSKEDPYNEIEINANLKTVDDPKYRYSVKNRTTMLVDQDDLLKMFTKDRNVLGNMCNAILNSDSAVLKEAYSLMMKKKRSRVSNYEYLHWTLNCAQFKQTRGYFDTSFTEEEKNFPIAFSILGYKNIEAIERFLRIIYRPQNYYCIHMDIKTSKQDLQTITAIADCFPNVFLSSRSLDVKWGEFAVLEADLICMRDLWRYRDWKYYINLTGQEMPLKTNLELVRILMAMRWANLVDGTWIRARHNYFYRWTKNGHPPPHNIRPIKGSVHVAINRDFVDFALHDQRSKDYLTWLNMTEIPDESFFSTLNHNPHLGIPGSFLGEPEEYARKPTFTRFKNWEIGHGVWLKQCAGKYVRNICIIGIGDLRLLKDDIGLFVNKISLDFEYLAFECLEELIYNRTRDQYLGREIVDTAFYETLDQIRFRLVV